MDLGPRPSENVIKKPFSPIKYDGQAHLLSGLLRCEECGGGFRCVNGREYGCASHRDGRSCGNGIRLPMKLAESKLLGALRDELLSPAGVALLEKRIREYLTEAGQGDAMPKVAEPEAVS